MTCTCAKIDTAMIIRNPEKNFEELWKTFHNRYPFFELRNVDWKKQYDTYRPKVTRETSGDELFDIFCQMLAPLHTRTASSSISVTTPAVTIVLQSRSSIGFATASESRSTGRQRLALAKMPLQAGRPGTSNRKVTHNLPGQSYS
jgi:Tricorn protease C1 domain